MKMMELDIKEPIDTITFINPMSVNRVDARHSNTCRVYLRDNEPPLIANMTAAEFRKRWNNCMADSEEVW